MLHLPEALAPLSAYQQFILYKIVPSKTRPGKSDKFPMAVDGRVVDAHDPANWLSADVALQMAQLFGDGHGVGFVFTDQDPFFFVDIDAAYDGQWSPLAVELCNTFTGAAVEVSQSGTGMHIIGTLSGAVPNHGCKNQPLGLECYTSERFVALTGTGATGSAAVACDTAFTSVVNQYFPFDATSQVSSEWTTTHAANAYPIQDDEKLIEKALKTESIGSMFGARASFKDLWIRNEPVLIDVYPHDQNAGEFDASSADAALAQHLSFWAGGNCERIERLMRRSALVRDKWDRHKSYMSRTITGAVGRSTQFYDVGKPLDIVEVDATPVLKEGYQFMSADQQIDHFKGCVYVTDVNRVFMPSGELLKSEQFNVVKGGYNFALDHSNEKTTKKAWEAFTESQICVFPKVSSTCFYPNIESGGIVEEEGRRLVNTFVPVPIDATPGDVTPFLTHLGKLLPDERDRTILLSYMAAVVQYKGHKFQWAPLIQGCEGNGKTLFTRCVAHAVGERYTHMPRADEIGEKFNAWLFDKIFIGVEDIHVPDHKAEIIEVLKPMITSTRLARRAMQTDQTMHNICANFIFNSNHKNAIKTTLNDRRYCVFFTAQQEAIDVKRDGMDGDYFPDLYKWLRTGGYAAVTAFLQAYDIPVEFNPTGICQRAPQTTSTMEAVTASMGSVEQEILEAIDEGRQGFANGWVSSFALDKLIGDMRKSNQVPRNKRRDLMRSLGYDWHPGLKDGRVNNMVMIENGKPRLFIKHGHLATNLTSAAAIANQYAADQGDPLAKAVIVDRAVNND